MPGRSARGSWTIPRPPWSVCKRRSSCFPVISGTSRYLYQSLQLTGTFATYRLFDALYKKASGLRKFVQDSTRRKNTCWPPMKRIKPPSPMLRYIEKSYDTDDAKLFLKKRAGRSTRGPYRSVSNCIVIHPREHYLEQAFMISERNKASIISGGAEGKNLPGGGRRVQRRHSGGQEQSRHSGRLIAKRKEYQIQYRPSECPQRRSAGQQGDRGVGQGAGRI